MPRKRTFAEVEAPEPPTLQNEPSLVQRIRNMWEFAATMQYIFLFGKIMKIDEDFDIEDFENECLQPGHSEKLEEVGLQLLRFISSNRGLNLSNWDEYVRRQYLSKSPGKDHPYGENETPNKFRSFDISTKIRVLHQLTNWTFTNPDRIRGTVPDLKESDQLDWRMNVFGYDEEDREYFVLDDSRLYRRTEPLLPPAPKAKPKANSKKARAAQRRASKRRRLEESETPSEVNDELDETMVEDFAEEEQSDPWQINTLGGYTWECVAITLEDYQKFIASLHTSVKYYPNEKQMRDRLVEEVLPIIQELADKQKRKQERRERELMMMERLAGAKRSSRLAGKQEREKKEQEEAENARKRAADLAAAHREQEKQAQMEKDRQSRMMTREQRIKDREYKRILMEDQIARDAEEAKAIEEGGKRGSERQIKDRIEKNKRELEELADEDEWTFDCSGCGVYGKNIDDGSHSIACEKCSVWQHSKCLGITKAAAEKDDFGFVCGDCKRKEQEAIQRKEDEERRREEEVNKPKILLKFNSGHSLSPPQQRTQPAQPTRVTEPGLVNDTNVPQSADVARGSTATSTANGYHGMNTPSKSHPSPSNHMINGLPQPYHRPSPPRPAQIADMLPGSQEQQVPNGFEYAASQSVETQPGATHQDHRFPHYANGSTSIPGPTPQRAGQFPSDIAQTPRPDSAHSHHQMTPANRIPSPILNKPKMSPTQGNPEVGPIAGFPNNINDSDHSELFTSQSNGSASQQVNGVTHSSRSSSPQTYRTSQTPNPQHMSGLSPVKQRSPPPYPPATSSFSSALHSVTSTQQQQQNNYHHQPVQSLRSISGTPIFPPAEKLAPSPEHMNKDPVPTPSKQATPGPTPNASFDSRTRTSSFLQQTPTHGGSSGGRGQE